MTTDIKSVVLSAAAHESIREHAPESADGRETGGILLGHLRGDVANVEHAGDAGPKAVRTPTFFLRDLRHA
ncbi:MAG: hypothetical protein QOC82_1736 [Frankiaceae bacterium]|jgi:hypothetical protein|nr:hypothetical protein [Frankiaceae bacterium]